MVESFQSKDAKLKLLQQMFIDNLSHELRTPVTVLRGCVDFLKDNNEFGASPDSRRAIELADRNLHRLSNVFNTIQLFELPRLPGGFIVRDETLL